MRREQGLFLHLPCITHAPCQLPLVVSADGAGREVSYSNVFQAGAAVAEDSAQVTDVHRSALRPPGTSLGPAVALCPLEHPTALFLVAVRSDPPS